MILFHYNQGIKLFFRKAYLINAGINVNGIQAIARCHIGLEDILSAITGSATLRF